MNSIKLNSALVAIGSIALSAIAGCTHAHQSPTPATAPAREYQAVDTSLAGTLLRIDAADTGVAIQAIDIPSGRSRSVLGPATELPGGYNSFFVWAAAGPDDSGQVAFIEAHGTPKDNSYAMKIIRIDGSGQRTIVHRQGDVIWKRAVGRSLALPAQGSKVALVGEMHGTQMPGALLEEGPLEIWDVTPGAAATPLVRTMVLDCGLAWLKDGKHIACVRLVPRSWVPANGANAISDPAPDGFGNLFAKWDRVPAICIVNAETGEQRTLCAGACPILSTDGQTMLVADLQGNHQPQWRKVDVMSGAFQTVPTPPGKLYRRYVALGASDDCLYLQLPQPGETSGITKYYSPLVGARQLFLLKAGKLGQAEGKTIGNDFDPRSDVSFSSK